MIRVFLMVRERERDCVYVSFEVTCNKEPSHRVA